MSALNLLGTTSRIVTPFIKVTIGQYTFGVFDKSTKNGSSKLKYNQSNIVQFPNYIERLTVEKINGKVNKYTLELNYPVNEYSDPNFFEKVFSSVSKTRNITFSYGDLSMPTFIYKEEKAIITGIKTNFNINSSLIKYTISAISTAILADSGCYSFKKRTDKPSDVIMELLYDKRYNLTEIFTGMKNEDLVNLNQLVPRDDRAVVLEAKTNISLLNYLSYLVSCMSPMSDNDSSMTKSSLYCLNVIDDTTGVYGGTYFKISSSKVTSDINTYTIDIGYPSQDVVTQFTIDEDSSYSILYDYANTLTPEQYSQRINNKGELERVFAPNIKSTNNKYTITEAERTWWTNVTQFPIKATLVVKGLLRPASLMTHVKVNVYFFGRKHIASGKYVITRQVDKVDSSGFTTTLSLTRIEGDNDIL